MTRFFRTTWVAVAVNLVIGSMAPLLVWGQSQTSMFDSKGEFHTGSFVSGNELWEMCKEDGADAIVYVLGVTDGFSKEWEAQAIVSQTHKELQYDLCLRIMGSNNDWGCWVPSICIPDGVTGSQLKDVVCRWVKEHPEDRHFSAASSIEQAYYSVWRCKEEDEVLQILMKRAQEKEESLSK